jgi:hypothetical protein
LAERQSTAKLSSLKWTRPTDAQGLVHLKVDKAATAKGDIKSGPDGKTLYGPDATAYCENHERYGHSTANCKKGKDNKKSRENKKKKAMAAKESDDNKDDFLLGATSENDTESANIAIYNQSALVSTNTQPLLVIDSGATDHFIRDKSLLFNTYALKEPVRIEIGDGKQVTASERGDLRIGRIVLKDALHVPDLAFNLISVRRIAKNKGWNWRFTDRTGQLFGPDGKAHLEANIR